jgi:glycosyltransferase involved in cell wall biosynthesis
MSVSLRDGLRARGQEAILLSSRASYGSGVIEADATCFGTILPMRQVFRLANPSAYLQLNRLLRQFRPDVVHVRMMTTQLSPLILPLLRGVPSIYHATWHEMICPNGLKMLPDLSICHEKAGLACLRNGCVSGIAWPFLAAQNRLLHRWRGVFTRVVANSHFLADQLDRANWAKAEVIWNGVPDFGQRDALSDPPTIAFSGRLTPEKGAETLIRALPLIKRTIPNVRLLIVGDGPQRSMLEDLCVGLGISSSVEFSGTLPRADAESILKRAWVQIVPSICQEGFGLVAAEALMRGTAVVASRRGGLTEIVQDGETGALVEPGDPVELAEAIRHFVIDKDKSERAGKAGRERALSHFRLDKYITKFLALYTTLVEEHGYKTQQRKMK